MGPPLRPQASRSSSSSNLMYGDGTDERLMLQAGRSTAHIAAQASAQSLREAARPASRPSSRQGSRSSSAAPNLLRKQSRPLSLVADTIPESNPPPLPRQPSFQRPIQAHEAAVSASLSETPSTSSNETSGGRSSDAGSENASASGSSGRTKSATPAGTALAAQMAAATRAAPSRPPLVRPWDSSYNNSTLSLSTPRSVRDLGADYTRYYNPFATHNSSQYDLSATPLPRYNSSSNLLGGASGAVSSTDLHQRLSNPFNDTKRHSDPFASRPQTSPGSPTHHDWRSMENVKGATAGVAEVAPPSRLGTPSFIRDADPEKADFFPWMDDRLGAPEYGFPLFSDQKEDDDDMHMPQWDDDVKLKPTFKDHFTRENIVSTFGLTFMLLGLLMIFVVLPVISYTGTSLFSYPWDTPLDQMPQSGAHAESWATVNNRTYSLLQNLRTGLIDPDTPKSAQTREGVHGDTFNLVFSDEFNAENRTFYPGDDPYWFGLDAWYGATQDLEWYDPDAVNTGDGTLQLQLDQFASHGLDYRSGMLNSWNQLCFKGGIFEVGMSLPGPAGVHGLWPGVWTMGNLGRPGYLATTDGLWPYTYDSCDVGITPNQSAPDGISYLPGQRLASCTCEGEDHPSPGTGRGAPEIDIAEVSGDWGGQGLGVATQSFQVAPFDIWWYPNYEFMQTPQYSYSMVNTYTGGPYQQAVSTTTMLNNDWYDGIAYQKYAFELAPGSGEDAYIAWTIGDNEMMSFDARAIGPNGNIKQRLVSEEPLSMILNLGFSHNWVDIEFDQLSFPTVMRIDYVRLYQKEGEESVTCDPPGYETTEYIKNHPKAYQNPNVTHWAETGYAWPKNTLMDGCSAKS